MHMKIRTWIAVIAGNVLALSARAGIVVYIVAQRDVMGQKHVMRQSCQSGLEALADDA